MSIFKVVSFNKATKIENRKANYFTNFSDAAEEAEDVAFNKFHNLKTAKHIDVLIYQYDFDGTKDIKTLIAHCPASAVPETKRFDNPMISVVC